MNFLYALIFENFEIVLQQLSYGENESLSLIRKQLSQEKWHTQN